MWITSSLDNSLQPTQVALGNFDGVHLGHCAVIQALTLDLVESPAAIIPPLNDENLIFATASTGSEGVTTRRLLADGQGYKTVVSFNPHPQVFFSGQPKPLLTLLPEKVHRLEQLGVEQLVLLPFNQTLADLSPEAFVEQILVQHLKAQKISVGFDFCFGRQRSGTAQDLQAIASHYNIPVIIVPPQTINGERISSSEVRQALSLGDVERAQQLLGYAYPLTGKVIQGQQLGRTLGFPTANLSIPEAKFIPRRGVYRVRVEGPPFPQSQLGVMNIGCRPTVDGHHETIEVYVLDWSGDLYGHTLSVHLEQFLRPEQPFESLDALKAQIQQDCLRVRQVTP